MESRRRHLNYISLASVVSSLAVIFLHVNGVFWEFENAAYWKSANVIESVFYFAVPVFFMITGATLMDYRKRYSTAVFLKKRFVRTVIPYLGWVLFELVFCVYYLKTTDPGQVTLRYVVNGVINGSLGTGIFWFFMPLFGVYLCMPLLSAVEERLRTPMFSYLAVLAFVLHSLIPFVIDLFHMNLSFTFRLPGVGEYLFYCIVGYLLVQNELSPRWRGAIYLLSLFALGLHMSGTYVLSMTAGAVSTAFKGYLSAPCAVYSVGVFVFLKYAGRRLLANETLSRLVMFLKNYTLPFYLIHRFVHDVLITEFSIDPRSLAYRLIGPVVIVIIVIPLTDLMRKVPVLRRFVP